MERGRQTEREGSRMEGEDGGRQQVVVMHRTFLTTLICNNGL